MGNTLDQMLDRYLFLSNAQLQKGPNSLEFSMQGAKGKIYSILPYVRLIYFDIHTRSLPESSVNSAALLPMHFNYCVDGRIELILDDNSYLYLKENDFCVSRQASLNESFPQKYYRGITLYFSPEFFSEANRSMSELFDLNLPHLEKIYLEKKGTYIGEANAAMQKILERLWQLSEAPSPFEMKLRVLELLHVLLDEKNIMPEKALTFYTSAQVEIAKKAEQMLTADLKQHIPIRQIAGRFGVSETSLKNYFRGVYGKNISDYLRDLRMSTAEKLLTETMQPISEIASGVGYTKQGKFAEVFRQRYHMNPLEYRRVKRMEKL